MTTLLIIIAFLALFLGYVVYNYDRDKSRWYVEQQQLQGKIDVLTEQLLQQAGHPIDLNKHMRDIFRTRVHDTAFKHGWKRDMPATPPENK